MTDFLWTSDELLAATGGTLSGAPFAANGVSIDTRSLEPGDLFVALDGVRDGHEFVAQALAAGAAAALVSKPVPGPHILVPDVLTALEQLAVAARDRCPAIRCAVTGSVGKTSVTQAVAAGLRLAGRAHSSIKSYNNHIGVPLTLARMPRDTERAVFEVGMNHSGEITPLSKLIAPHVAVITTVGPVHMEAFPEGEIGIARAKAEIFDGVLPAATAILNADNPWYDLLKAAAEGAGAKVRSFGAAEDADARLTRFTTDSYGSRVQAVWDRELLFSYPLRQKADHWGLTSLCTLLALEAMGLNPVAASRALADFEPLAGRGAEHSIGGYTLIDEAYNANPLSMASAIRTLGSREGRRIAVLTDMLELGDDGPAIHAALASYLQNASVDLVFVAGPLMKSLWDNLPSTQRGAYASSAEALIPSVVETVRPGDVVMVKGSNGSKAHLIAAALAKPAERD